MQKEFNAVTQNILNEIASRELQGRIETGAQKAIKTGNKFFCVKTQNNMRGYNAELSDLCEKMKKTFGAVAEISSNRRDNELVVFMHKKPSFIKRWILTLPTREAPDVHDLVGFS